MWRKAAWFLRTPTPLQRDERFFPDAGHFDPERFAAGWEERIPRYAYLRFGSGPRVCIGNGFAMMETRLILAAMVKRYRFKLEGEAEIRPVQIVTLRPARPVRMRLERRWIARVTSMSPT